MRWEDIPRRNSLGTVPSYINYGVVKPEREMPEDYDGIGFKKGAYHGGKPEDLAPLPAPPSGDDPGSKKEGHPPVDQVVQKDQ